MMKKGIVLFGLSLLLTTSLLAQQWTANWGEAQKQANEKERNILLVFSGSDWCGPCIKLEKTIWQSAEFTAHAGNHLILYRADFPKSKKNQLTAELKKENGELAEKYNPQGLFPLVVLLDKQGKILGTTGYKNISPTEYIRLLESFEKKKL